MIREGLCNWVVALENESVLYKLRANLTQISICKSSK